MLLLSVFVLFCFAPFCCKFHHPITFLFLKTPSLSFISLANSSQFPMNFPAQLWVSKSKLVQTSPGTLLQGVLAETLLNFSAQRDTLSNSLLQPLHLTGEDREPNRFRDLLRATLLLKLSSLVSSFVHFLIIHRPTRTANYEK